MIQITAVVEVDGSMAVIKASSDRQGITLQGIDSVLNQCDELQAECLRACLFNLGLELDQRLDF